MMNIKALGVSIATAAVLTLALVPASFAAKKVDCYGANTCKGKVGCVEKEMIKVTAKNCKKMGGSTTAPAATTNTTTTTTVTPAS
jgi:hypothetical protein